MTLWRYILPCVYWVICSPQLCNDPDYREALMEKVKQYNDATEYEALSYLYAENIANGRFLWRNRVGAEAVEVQVEGGR